MKFNENFRHTTAQFFSYLNVHSNIDEFLQNFYHNYTWKRTLLFTKVFQCRIHESPTSYFEKVSNKKVHPPYKSALVSSQTISMGGSWIRCSKPHVLSYVCELPSCTFFPYREDTYVNYSSSKRCAHRKRKLKK